MHILRTEKSSLYWFINCVHVLGLLLPAGEVAIMLIGQHHLGCTVAMGEVGLRKQMMLASHWSYNQIKYSAFTPNGIESLAKEDRTD